MSGLLIASIANKNVFKCRKYILYELLHSKYPKMIKLERTFFHKSTPSYIVALVRREQKALHQLLLKSTLSRPPTASFPYSSSMLRCLHTSPSCFYSDNNDRDKKDKENNDDDESKMSLLAKAAIWMMSAYITISLMSLLFPSTNQPEITRFVSWHEFLHHMLAKGEVQELIVNPELEIVTIIVYENAIIKGKRVTNKTFHMNIPDIKHFEEKLRESEKKLGIAPGNGVTVIYDRNQDNGWILLASVLAVSLMTLLMVRKGGIMTGVNSQLQNSLTRAKFTMIDPLIHRGKGVRFDEVAGMKEAKIEVMEFVDYLKRPDFYKNLGAKVPKGALLLGPPGCGKTLLAKAVATEANVPFLAMAGPEFMEMIGGLGAARVRDLFKQARKRSPCIVYIDEIDTIGRKRVDGDFASGAGGEEEQTLNQLLVEMDGMATREGVVLLASTNRPEVLDKALMRPGRFDRHILIDLPTLQERKEIFEQHLKPIKLVQPPHFYSQRMASLTPRFSGADIANVCNEAALYAARKEKKIVDSSDLEYAVERVIGGTEKRTQVMSPEERRIVAFHEAGHALVGWMLKHTDALLKVSIVPRTSKTLGFAQYHASDQKLYTTEQLFERMCMALGGRVAESLVFNRITTGAEDDLKKVTNIAYRMIKVYGMNDSVGLVSFDDERGGKKPYSKKLAASMDEEARRLLARVYMKTEQVLNENMDKLKLIAETLIKKEVLNYDDFKSLIGPPPHGTKSVMQRHDLEAFMREEGRPLQKEKESEESEDNGQNEKPEEEKYTTTTVIK